MENKFSIVETLYRLRTDHELLPDEQQFLRQSQAADPVLGRIADRLDSHRKPVPDLYAALPEFTNTRMHHIAVGALLFVMGSFFASLIWLVVANGH